MYFFSSWRRKRLLRRHAIPEALWQEALSSLPFLAAWPPGELEALRARAVLFLCEKDIVGAGGFKVEAFHRVVVALQACIPVLKLGLEWYDAFKTVVLYAEEFMNESAWEDEDGLMHYDEAPLAGEAMVGGPVVLSWPEAAGLYRESEGEGGEAAAEEAPPLNVVIHEFVHKLDMKTGEANGCPPLPPGLPAKYWQAVMSCAYEDFCRRVEKGEALGIDAYAAEHPSEFFAVLSETYFIAPARLREAYPEVYACLRLLYGFEVNAPPQP